ncbi:LysR family transcriptional regulator [Sphingobium sp. MK2]|uniref:LysR family transcriptional regulator n=1 Tax=Sphingobium sp. MK2 TaxID=3116540 RepID=UPI0032E35F16
MSLRAVNLNLLPVLQVLLREKNLTRAANLLGLTQPALSMALGRLRQVLEDPLLVREGRQMVLTIKAQELVPVVEDICARIEYLLPLTGFDPQAERGKWVIASSDYGFHLIAAEITEKLRQNAPHALLHLVDVPHTDLEPHAGEVDCFILPRQIIESGRFANMRHERLTTDYFVAIASKATAARCRGGATPERFAIYYPGLATVDVQALGILNGWGNMTGTVAVQVQHFNLLPSVVRHSDCAAIMPRKLADLLCVTDAFEIVDIPGISTEPMEMVLAWYASQTSQPRNRWFRSLILEIGRSAQP